MTRKFSTDDLPATEHQVDTIVDLAFAIEREVPGPFTRGQAHEEIRRLRARKRELEEQS